MASKYLWLLDPGHGAETPGKRSPVWPDGRQLLEYEFNRDIVDRVMKYCNAHDIDHVNLVPEQSDVPLKTRVRRANQYHHRKKCIFLSFHANGGGGTGWEAWTHKGESLSDKVASIFYSCAQNTFPGLRMRKDMTDGDADKESERLYVLKKTWMPAVILEHAFMDTLKPDCELMLSPKGRARFAWADFMAIRNVEQYL